MTELDATREELAVLTRQVGEVRNRLYAHLLVCPHATDEERAFAASVAEVEK